LGDAVPFCHRGEASGFHHITEQPQGFRLHGGTGIREKGFFVNSMMGPPHMPEAVALKFHFDLVKISA
jgi:hypothetical protein